MWLFKYNADVYFIMRGSHTDHEKRDTTLKKERLIVIWGRSRKA